jgi:modulator of FtsH protease HflC
MKRRKFLVFTVSIILIAAWAQTALFVVEASETAVTARFSRPLAPIYQPGLHIKAPWPIDSVYRFDKRILIFDHVPTEFLTKDKKNILIDSFAVWRIQDEHKYLARVRNRNIAEVLLLEMITASVGELAGSYPLSSFINADPSKIRLKEINKKLTDACRRAAEKDYGMEIIDARINMFNFPEQNRTSVISRMQAERARIATKYRSEGQEEALKIEAATEKERRSILAEARREAQVIRGKGEAEAIRIYGEAYSSDAEFYDFLRSLEAYGQIVDKDTTVILDRNSKIFKTVEKAAP